MTNVIFVDLLSSCGGWVGGWVVGGGWCKSKFSDQHFRADQYCRSGDIASKKLGINMAGREIKLGITMASRDIYLYGQSVY